MAMSEAAKHIKWMRKLWEEFDFEQLETTLLRVDNQDPLVWGNQGVQQARHVSIKVNFLKECRDRGILRLQYCKSSEMVADLLTKPLLRFAFEKHRKVLCRRFNS